MITLKKEYDYFSARITWYNFILCTLVVLIHADNVLDFPFASSWLATTEHFIKKDIATVGVGGFFLCSGYLFFKNYGWNKILEKYKSRIRSILLPYIFWTFTYYILHLIFSRIAPLQTVFGESNIPFNLQTIFDAIINYRYCAFFWFLQFLIVYIFISPFLYAIIQHKYIGSILLVLLFSGINILGNLIASAQLSAMINWLTLYMLGGYAGMHFSSFMGKKMTCKEILPSTIFTICTYILYKKSESAFTVLLYSLAFSLTLWLILSQAGKLKTYVWQKNTFAVYVTHFLMVRLINTLGGKLFPSSAPLGIVLFLFAPVICFTIIAVAKKICKNGNWLLWKIAFGGR